MAQRKYDFLGGVLDRLKPPPAPPRPPSPPKPPVAITPGTPQYELVQAQDSARANPQFKRKDDGTTFCNRATCEIVKRMKGPLEGLTYPNGEYAVANDAARYLAQDAATPTGRWRTVDSPEEAQQLGNQGALVVGVQRNPGRDGQGRQRHGHMVTVRPELMPGLAESLGQAPIINNIGSELTIEPAGTAFLENGQPVFYYTPRTK